MLLRQVALQLFSAQHFGLGISNADRDQIVYGDLAGMALALVVLVALRAGARFWKPLAWLFVLETVVDLGNAAVVGLRGGLLALALGSRG